MYSCGDCCRFNLVCPGKTDSEKPMECYLSAIEVGENPSLLYQFKLDPPGCPCCGGVGVKCNDWEKCHRFGKKIMCYNGEYCSLRTVANATKQLQDENAKLRKELKMLKTCGCLEGNQDCMCCPEHQKNWRANI